MPFKNDTSAILERRRKALRQVNMADNEKQRPRNERLIFIYVDVLRQARECL
jgi:hypothetical protein